MSTATVWLPVWLLYAPWEVPLTENRAVSIRWQPTWAVWSMTLLALATVDCLCLDLSLQLAPYTDRCRPIRYTHSNLIWGSALTLLAHLLLSPSWPGLSELNYWRLDTVQIPLKCNRVLVYGWQTMGCHGKLCPTDAFHNGALAVSSHLVVCAPGQHTSAMVTAVYQNNLPGDRTPQIHIMLNSVIWTDYHQACWIFTCGCSAKAFSTFLDTPFCSRMSVGGA